MGLQLGRGLAAWLFFCLIASAQAQELKLDRDALIRAKSYEADLIETSGKYGLDPRLLWTIAYLETRFDPKLVSRKGARGLMQLMPATAARLGIEDPHDPKSAIDAAARYARYLTDRFGGKVHLTLAAYNAGEGAVEAYQTGRAIRVGKRIINPARRITGGVPPYREMQNYVAKGLRILNRLANTPALSSVVGRDSLPPHGSARKSAFIAGSDSIEKNPSLKNSQSKSLARRSVSFTFRVE
ncbi:MAG TPA: lytic transglycosylase domain-containing protein [Blastocatellia bacterium]